MFHCLASLRRRQSSTVIQYTTNSYCVAEAVRLEEYLQPARGLPKAERPRHRAATKHAYSGGSLP